mmetsp:Transcript_18568/g.27540  ORF Transcript_18568/g.27540 Transcript_18568/m.27540 type:complete len:184 (+) Transcript_18568:39-590(+)
MVCVIYSPTKIIDGVLILSLAFGGYYSAIFLIPSLNESENPLQAKKPENVTAPVYENTQPTPVTLLDKLNLFGLSSSSGTNEWATALLVLLALGLAVIIFAVWLVKRIIHCRKWKPSNSPATSEPESTKIDKGVLEETEPYESSHDVSSKYHSGIDNDNDSSHDDLPTPMMYVGEDDDVSIEC